MDISMRIAAIVRVLEQATDMIKALDGDISNMDEEQVLDAFEALDSLQDRLSSALNLIEEDLAAVDEDAA